MTTPIAHEELARQALDGDRDALDTRVRALQGDVYGLALRMPSNQSMLIDEVMIMCTESCRGRAGSTRRPPAYAHTGHGHSLEVSIIREGT